MSQGHNSNAVNGAAPGSTAAGEEEWRDKGEMQLSKGRRAKKAKVKQAMQSSCNRARRWHDRAVNLTNKGMSHKDLLETMQRKHECNREYTNAKLEEMVGKNTEEK